ncbi:MAG: tyrosine--tRNA ligase [Acidimicrobiia bacterium]
MANHLQQLLRGTDTVLPEGDLEKRLDEARPLRVKLGMDPTAPAVTLGWAVVLRKLRQFQEQGHIAVLIVGDFTAQVGDPSGKSETRRRLSAEEVRGHADSVLEGFRKVLLPDRLEIRYNSEWLGSMDMADVLDMTSHVTVAQMLERSDFAKRFDSHEPISVMEFMYPLLQGMDSVAVEADIELGGADQLWNLMVGRVLQERHGQRPQISMTMPLLIGTDGEHKMSQSLGNYIGIDEQADEMFGKVMSIPDKLTVQYFELATAVPMVEVAEISEGLASGEFHPGEIKRRLAREIVDLYHGDGAGLTAEQAFDQVFKRHEIPDEVPEHVLPSDDPVFIPVLLKEAGLVGSSSDGRRMIAQGAVKLNGEALSDLELGRQSLAGGVIQVGKRRFVRLI